MDTWRASGASPHPTHFPGVSEFMSETLQNSDVAGSRRPAIIALAYGVLCHATFLAAVGFMIYSMYSGMRTGSGTLPTPWSWVANSFLLLQFFFLHSFLLSSRGRPWLQKLAPPDLAHSLATTTYVTIAALQTLLLFALWSPSGIVWWQATGWARVLLTASYAGAWLMLFRSMSDAGFALQTGLLGWRAVWNGTRPVYPPMPERGMFRLCRQPIYLSFALTLWTVPVWTPDQLLLATVLTAYCIAGPLFKEKRFARIYKEKFVGYQRRIPYWLPWPRKPIRNNQDIYIRDADDWWSGNHRWLRTLRNIVPARFSFFDTVVKDWRGKHILDIGCGGGFMSEELAKRGAKVTGIDPSAPAIAAARVHAAAQGLDIDYRVGFGEQLPLADESVDCVVIVDVLEHVAVDPVLDEIRRVLKPDGLILFDTINRTWLAAFVFVTLGENILRISPTGTHDPAMFIRPDELAAKLRLRHFVPARMSGLGPRGIDARGDATFGLLKSMSLQYVGYAIKRG
jgi:ubiquinone biosynthesis O-methyltransferase